MGGWFAGSFWAPAGERGPPYQGSCLVVKPFRHRTARDGAHRPGSTSLPGRSGEAAGRRPGAYDTELSRDNVSPERRAEFTRRTPADRRGRPEEPVGPVLLLASAASSYVTGASLAVDGGFLISPVSGARRAAGCAPPPS